MIIRTTKTANPRISGGIGERKDGMLRPAKVEWWIDEVNNNKRKEGREKNMVVWLLVWTCSSGKGKLPERERKKTETGEFSRC